MRSIGNRRCVAAGVAWLTILAGFVFAQEMARPAATQSQATGAATRPAASQPGTFEAHATLGPALPDLAQPDEKGNVQYAVLGPLWDGVNNGLWVILRDLPSVIENRGGPCIAILIDPTGGYEKTRLSLPSAEVIGHDGVGLWCQVDQKDSDGREAVPILQRVRTAPELTPHQKEMGWQLPADVKFPVSSTRCFDLFEGEAPVSVCSFFRSGSQPFRIYLDLQKATMYQPFPQENAGEPANDGGGYLWLTVGKGPHRDRVQEIQRVPIASLRNVSESGRIRAMPTKGFQVADLDGVRGFGRQLAWDGQRLWAVSRAGPGIGEVLKRPDGEILFAPEPQVRLVCIDVGLNRKADTDERYKKALAFEKKNGTVKALPLFEELIAYDPAAVEIRNHVAWALGTRPQEPYHDIPRAKTLVESALEWQPWNPEMWDTLAEIYWRLGNAQLAEHLEAKAINLNPAKTFYWKQLDKFRAGPTTQEAPEPAY